jgi:hypothetical protein
MTRESMPRTCHDLLPGDTVFTPPISNFRRHVNLGKAMTYNSKGHVIMASVFATIEYRDGKLSITGVHGPRSNGDAYGSCGQCIDTARTCSPRFADLWDRWHLNDMRPGCEHQRDWDTVKKLEVPSYTWSNKFHQTRNAIADGEQQAPSNWPEIVRQVQEVCMGGGWWKLARNRFLVIAECLAGGWIKLDKVETKGAGWVYPHEHTEGTLTKPCSVCGYKYGSAWNREEVPADILAELQAWPAGDLSNLPWCWMR